VGWSAGTLNGHRSVKLSIPTAQLLYTRVHTCVCCIRVRRRRGEFFPPSRNSASDDDDDDVDDDVDGDDSAKRETMHRWRTRES
jgi:hypothetical protein